MAAEATKKDNFDKLAIASMLVDRVFEWEASENQSHSGCDLGSVIFEAFRAPGKTIKVLQECGWYPKARARNKDRLQNRLTW